MQPKAYNYLDPDVRRVWGKISVTCTGGLYGIDRQTGKSITIDSWVSEVHHLIYEQGAWRFLGNASGASSSAPVGSAPHHPLF